MQSQQAALLGSIMSQNRIQINEAAVERHRLVKRQTEEEEGEDTGGEEQEAPTDDGEDTGGEAPVDPSPGDDQGQGDDAGSGDDEEGAVPEDGGDDDGDEGVRQEQTQEKIGTLDLLPEDYDKRTHPPRRKEGKRILLFRDREHNYYTLSA